MDAGAAQVWPPSPGIAELMLWLNLAQSFGVSRLLRRDLAGDDLDRVAHSFWVLARRASESAVSTGSLDAVRDDLLDELAAIVGARTRADAELVLWGSLVAVVRVARKQLAAEPVQESVAQLETVAARLLVKLEQAEENGRLALVRASVLEELQAVLARTGMPMGWPETLH
jgi:hypothetical protein